ncbi:MAG TPA: DNA helicase RecQ [Paracoccaceae bacterium]|nr:DNA helicase RecQ [Paracoccaceae bacterium]
MRDPETILHDVFGFAGFRPGQEEIVRAVLDGEDVLAVMPTGGGKSLCYQLPALARGGLTVVVSPLIALMRDQVAALRAYGVEAGALNSANDAAENDRISAALNDGSMRLLYVSPERLAGAGTQARLAKCGVGLLAIDEAHCVSEWGHDFRPEYAALGGAREAVGAKQAMALTATADAATRADIEEKLFPRPPRVFVQGFDRPNLRLAMAAKQNATRQVVDLAKQHRGESGIIYCSSRKQTEKIAEALRGEGFRALPYHAGLDPAERTRNQDVFVGEDSVVMAATVAFGMGVDKPDVRFVAHAALPKTIEAYYQEIGRAGRDGLPADTLTLYGWSDIKLRQRQIEESGASEDKKRLEFQKLNALLALAEAPECRRQTLLAYFGDALEAPCGHCDLCESEAEPFDGTVEAQKILSAIYRTGQRFGASHIADVLAGNETEAVKRWGHDSIKTFGAGAARPKTQWQGLIRQVYAAGLAEMEIGEYGGLSLTAKGAEVLRGERTVRLRLDTLGTRRARRQRRSAASPELSSRDGELFERLRTLRAALAREAKLPAYVVFTDRTLIEMAQEKPRTLDAMARLHGVGARKLDRYGAAFLEAIETAT